MSKLRVTFEDPKAGVIWMHLQSATQSVSISATYIFNGFFSLVNALYRVYLAPVEEIATWMCEPSEVEMRFSRQEDVISLNVLWFRDGRRSVFSEPVPELSVSGSYAEVCLPFWRALRHLQGRFSVTEFEERWRSAFPTQELARLTQELGK